MPMQSRYFLFISLIFILFSPLRVVANAPSSAAESGEVITSHGFSRFGSLKYSADFTHFEYVNPDAPKGGEVRLMASGTFDSLNPYILKGTSPFNTPGFFLYGVNELNETLLVGTGSVARTGDESQSAYGLLAESLTYPADFSWVIFTLRDEARFHDGEPVQADDVAFSYNILLEKGHPRFQLDLAGIKSVEVLSPKQVKVHMEAANSADDILRFGEMPILPEHYWKDRDFAATTLEPPLLSGPYRVASVKAGQSLVYERVTDYWGKDLPVNKGKYNFDKVRFDFYRDLTVAFEAFKSHEFDVYLDYIAKNWAKGYDIPAVQNGTIIKQQIGHQIPSNVQGFFLNSRRSVFSDVRVREAIGLMFDFEWTNRNLFFDAYVRTKGYFPNSPHEATGLPSDEETELLKPFKDSLPESVFQEPWTPPVTDGSGSVRKQKRTALKLLKESGWNIDAGILKNSAGQQFGFEILIRQQSIQRVLTPFVNNLQGLGIEVSIRLVDTSQYKQRLDDFDFDMTTFVLPQSPSPAQELADFYHSRNANTKGSRNYAGVNHPAVDAAVEAALAATSEKQLITATRALDRVLRSQHYMIPNWYLDAFRIAYWNRFQRPAIQPPYALGLEHWWLKPTAREYKQPPPE